MCVGLESETPATCLVFSNFCDVLSEIHFFWLTRERIWINGKLNLLHIWVMNSRRSSYQRVKISLPENFIAVVLLAKSTTWLGQREWNCLDRKRTIKRLLYVILSKELLEPFYNGDCEVVRKIVGSKTGV